MNKKTIFIAKTYMHNPMLFFPFASVHIANIVDINPKIFDSSETHDGVDLPNGVGTGPCLLMEGWFGGGCGSVICGFAQSFGYGLGGIGEGTERPICPHKFNDVSHHCTVGIYFCHLIIRRSRINAHSPIPTRSHSISL